MGTATGPARGLGPDRAPAEATLWEMATMKHAVLAFTPVTDEARAKFGV